MAKIQMGQALDLLALSQAEAKVGDYKWSHLETAPFGDEHLGEWMLCDGQSAVGTAFATLTGETNVPNALAEGTFIRQAKAGRTKGTYEADQIQGHQHASESWAGQGGAGYQNPNNAGYGNAGPYGNNVLTREMRDMAGAGTVRQGDETRSKNIALNLYVKVGY